MNPFNSSKIIQFARECAAAAIHAGGPSPTNIDGGSLLPRGPLPGDWAFLREQMGGNVAVAEEAQFEAEYVAVMKTHLGV